VKSCATLLCILAAASAACSKVRRHKSVTAVPSLDRALQAIDEGDLARAERVLRMRPHPGPSEKVLLEAIHQTDAKGGYAPSLLANVRARVVPRPPFEPPAKVKAATCSSCPRVASWAKVEATPVLDVLSALGDPLYDTRGARNLDELLGGKDAMPAVISRLLPASYGGAPLVMALPQRDERWLLLFGRDIGRARFIALVDPRPSANPDERITVFDFKNFIEPPETIEPRETHETITWAELDGDRLFVANAHSNNPDASNGKNAYLTAIDVKTDAIIWRSAGQVAGGSSFVVTDTHVICAYEDFYYMQLFTLDRDTGKIVGSVALPEPARAIWVQDGKLRARALDNEVRFVQSPGLRDSVIGEKRQPAIERLAKLLPAPKLPAFAVEPAASRKRAMAIARLDQGRPLEASKILRATVEADGLAGNLATQALLQAAEASVETARASAEAAVERAHVVVFKKPPGNRPAPVEHGPALRLEKVSEAKHLPLRGASIFDERGITPVDIDLPYPHHVGDLPDYVPARFDTRVLFNARYTSSSRVLIAAYAGTTVLFDTERREPESRLDFGALGASSDFPQITRLEIANNVVLAAVPVADHGDLTAFDRKTGEAYWTRSLTVIDMLLVDGWLVVNTPSEDPGRDYATDVLVLDATTGAEISRVHTVRTDSIVRQGDEIIGGGPTSRVVLAIKRGP
jgi:hypothetical protein